jgi:hypothetical protein
MKDIVTAGRVSCSQYRAPVAVALARSSDFILRWPKRQLALPASNAQQTNFVSAMNKRVSDTAMSTRGSAGLNASILILTKSPSLVTFRPKHSLRPFSKSAARRKSSKIRTRFSGPQPKSARDTVALAPVNEQVQKLRVSNPSPLRTQVPAISDEKAISFAETHPFPDQDLSSTRPARLQTPKVPTPWDHGGVALLKARLSYLYRLGKSFLTFYRTGLKNVWFNYKEYRKIKARLGPFPLNDVVKYSGKGGRPTISRKEYQLYLRTRHDIRKLIPFGLILLICGEFTPFVVLALGSAVVPSTCQIPAQVVKDHVKAAERLKRLTEVSFIDENTPVASLSSSEARIGYLWGLMPSPRPLPLIHHLLRPRLKNYAEELVCDAILVRREGGLARLDGHELTLFAAKASRARLERLVGGALHSPSPIDAGETRKRFELSYEEYIDDKLALLRNLEDTPSQHYRAAFNY